MASLSCFAFDDVGADLTSESFCGGFRVFRGLWEHTEGLPRILHVLGGSRKSVAQAYNDANNPASNTRPGPRPRVLGWRFGFAMGAFLVSQVLPV